MVVRVFIADDHHLVRQGLRRLVESEDSAYLVVGEEGDGEIALNKIKEIKPDIAVLDINMPNLTGLQIARKIKNAKLNIKIIILTMYKDEEYLKEAMDSGVKGYLLKEDTENELLGALSAVEKDELYVSPLVKDFSVGEYNTDTESGLLSKLTPTERKVLQFISKSKTSKEIASEMFISYKTVDNHRSSICMKLNLKGPNKLIQFALNNKNRF